MTIIEYIYYTLYSRAGGCMPASLYFYVLASIRPYFFFLNLPVNKLIEMDCGASASQSAAGV